MSSFSFICSSLKMIRNQPVHTIIFEVGMRDVFPALLVNHSTKLGLVIMEISIKISSVVNYVDLKRQKQEVF